MALSPGLIYTLIFIFIFIHTKYICTCIFGKLSLPYQDPGWSHCRSLDPPCVTLTFALTLRTIPPFSPIFLMSRVMDDLDLPASNNSAGSSLWFDRYYRVLLWLKSQRVQIHPLIVLEPVRLGGHCSPASSIVGVQRVWFSGTDIIAICYLQTSPGTCETSYLSPFFFFFASFFFSSRFWVVCLKNGRSLIWTMSKLQTPVGCGASMALPSDSTESIPW